MTILLENTDLPIRHLNIFRGSRIYTLAEALQLSDKQLSELPNSSVGIAKVLRTQLDRIVSQAHG